jgi:hypothetical protein
VLPEGTQVEAELLPRDENDNPILPPEAEMKPPSSAKGSVKGSSKGKKSKVSQK